MTPHEEWEARWLAWCAAWNLANPRPSLLHTEARAAWRERKDNDATRWQRENPAPARTPEEEAALEPLRRLHRALGGDP